MKSIWRRKPLAARRMQRKSLPASGFAKQPGIGLKIPRGQPRAGSSPASGIPLVFNGLRLRTSALECSGKAHQGTSSPLCRSMLFGGGLLSRSQLRLSIQCRPTTAGDDLVPQASQDGPERLKQTEAECRMSGAGGHSLRPVCSCTPGPAHGTGRCTGRASGGRRRYRNMASRVGFGPISSIALVRPPTTSATTPPSDAPIHESLMRWVSRPSASSMLWSKANRLRVR
jgi:hypothetical protein